MTEHWAAYVDYKDWGVGAYVPVADRLTCYHFQGGKSSCSYFAPLLDLTIKPGTVFVRYVVQRLAHGGCDAHLPVCYNGRLSAGEVCVNSSYNPEAIMSQRSRTSLALVIALLWCCPLPVTAAGPDQVKSPPGIGFLWTAQSESVVGRLNTERDFVDLILGPGKMDVFNKVKPPLKVACIARSLERNAERPFPGIKETIDLLRGGRIAPERVIIVYNPEGQPGTPAQELRDLVANSRKAKVMAQAYGALLAVGPGLRDMQAREHLYPELAKTCDIWMIQSQRLQLDEATRKPVEVGVYRKKVKRIVDKLREGNPKIRVFVQLVTTAERSTVVLSADQIVSFARSVEDLVDAVRIYGAPADLLNQIIERLRGTVTTGHRS